MTYREALKARIAAAKAWSDGLSVDAPEIVQVQTHCTDAEFIDRQGTDVELLLAQLERAEAALGDLLDSGLDVNGGRNLGKSWSEYQVEDGAVNDAHEALASLRAVLDADVEGE